jgi:hypothetical protein
MADHYVQLAPEHKRKAVEKLEQFNLEQLLAGSETASPYNFHYSELPGDFRDLVNC